MIYPPPELLRHWRGLLAATGGVTLLLGGAIFLRFRRRPTAAQREERRRLLLATHGRIIDGALTGIEPSEQQPEILFYTYRVAGVIYECSQDISALPGSASQLQLDRPIQVRYAPENPGNSIVLAETWNGLWTLTPHA